MPQGKGKGKGKKGKKGKKKKGGAKREAPPEPEIPLLPFGAADGGEPPPALPLPSVAGGGQFMLVPTGFVGGRARKSKTSAARPSSHTRAGDGP